MLNIGRLGAGAADYYLGEVAASPEQYYTGSGEAAGRWLGSLAPALGLHGDVGATDLRTVLAGRHPITGEQLVVRPGSTPTGPPQNQRLPLQDDRYDIARAAARLRLSISQVRRLLWAGERAEPGTAAPYLLGERRRRFDSGPGRPGWLVQRSELDRFEATTGHRRGRPGFDLTFRPPKSVSVVWALAGDDVRGAIRQAHREAVDAVIDHLEHHALVSRRWSQGRTDAIGADGFVAAAFDHRTSRSGDPLLHTHVVTANLTRTIDGRWRTLDARPIYEHARPAGVLYQAHLRRLLHDRLGIQWEDVRNGWAEIRGVPREVIRAFSKRRDEIEEIVAESGYTSARAQQAATLASRRAKEHGADPIALVDGWCREAASLGFDDAAVADCLGRTPSRPIDREALLDELASAEGLTKHAASFARCDVVEAIAERSQCDLSVTEIDALADGFLASARCVPISATGTAEYVWRRADSLERDVDRMRFTTPDLIAMEDDLLRWAGSSPSMPPHSVSAEVLGKVLGGHPSLSDEQVAMVRSLAMRGAPVQTVAGRPGSGKTTATAVYVEALVAAEVPVVGCSLAATAAGELERACAFRARTGRAASTVARLLLELDRQALARGTIVVVDEASMIGTRDLHQLAKHAAAADGRLVLIGDPDQHGAVETGGVFRALVASDPDGTTLLANNRQHEARDRRAIELFREGNVEAALSRYDDAGLVVRSPSASASFEAMVDDWWEHARGGSRDPMIVGTNHGRRQLNERARQKLLAAGMVWGPGMPGRDGVDLTAGDWVVARRNDRRITTEDGEGIRNGDRGRITSVDVRTGAIVVDFEDKGAVRLPPAYVRDHVQHGYARTTYGVQGATLDRAFVHVDDRTGFEEAYVAMTRGRVETRLYLVDGTALPEDDSSHRAHATADTGLDTVAEAMRRRRAGVMVHDLDPFASATRDATTTDLATLRRDRRRHEAALSDAPADVSDALCEAIAARDRVCASIAAHDLATRRPGAGRRLERDREQLDRRVETLRRRHQRREQFLVDHDDEVRALRLIRRAELAREAQVRAQARIGPSPAIAVLLGRGAIGDRAVGDAAEALAVHEERFGIEPRDSEGVAAAIGVPPIDAEARFSYDRVARLLRAAEEAVVEVVRVEPTPSLFD